MTALLFALYGLAVSASVWLVLVPFEAIRILAGRSSFTDLLERLGLLSPPPLASRRLLLHAVSVGEVAAAEALLHRLLAIEPALSVVLTSGNREGRAAARRLAERLPRIEATPFLPWDRARAVQRFLARTRPDLVAVVETEIWPNLFRACPALRIPLAVVNGRVYPRDVARYHGARFFFRRVLACAEWIGVQSEEEWNRFLTIGAREDTVHVAGDLKFDRPGPAAGTGGSLAEALGPGGPLVVAGSTHAPEEKQLLSALAGLRQDVPKARLVLAPRHTERAASLVRQARRRGFAASLFSGCRPGEAWDVLILDRMGLLADAYGCAAAAFVGGSLVKKGGHNPLEAAARGVPVVMGPHVSHVEGAVAVLEKADALVRVDGAAALGEALRGLLTDETRRAGMGRRARAAFEAGRGSADVYARALLLALR